jgi:NADH:ubiquinone reductase (H+-translocating)
VTQVEAGAVDIGHTRLPATVVLWAAGVAASPLGKKLTGAVDRAGRVPVEPDLSLPGHPEVFVIGDLAAAKDETGKMLPGVAPVAIQQGKFVAKLIQQEVEAKPGTGPRPAFHYWDKGSLATIGRAAAVAQFGKIHISGFIAWLSWLFVHILFLIGFRNRLLVFIQWAWSYVTYERGARLITGSTYLPGWTGPDGPKKVTNEQPVPQEISSSAHK